MAGNIYAWSTTAASNASADSTINWAEGQLPSTVNDSARAEMAVHAAFLADNNATLTTSGSGTAYTVTSNLTSTLITGVRLRLKMHATNSSGACTLNVTPSGGAAFGAKAIKVINYGGEADPVIGDIQINGLYDFNYDSTAASSSGAWILENASRPTVSRISGFNCGITVSASTSALNISLVTPAGATPSAADPVFIQFRNSAAATGTVSPLAVTAATTLTISAGSTMGVTSSTAFRIWIVGFNDGGTFRLGAVNCSTGSSSGATIYGVLNSADSFLGGIGSATSEGGAGAADSAGVIYANATVTDKPMRILGFADWNISGLTAGTWTTSTLNVVHAFTPETPLPGRILQVVGVTSSNNATTNVTTYTNSGFTAAITPQSGTSIIRFQAMGPMRNSVSDGMLTRASRGTTANTNMFGSESIINAAAATTTMFTNIGWDKPNTSGSLTYAVQYKSSLGGTATIGNNNNVSVELQELMG